MSESNKGYILNLNFRGDAIEVADRVQCGEEVWHLDMLLHLLHLGEPSLRDCGEWSAPKGARTGDAVFVMCAKSASDKLRRVASELDDARNEIAADAVRESLDRARELGGCVFAAGCVIGDARLREECAEWGRGIYAPVALELVRPAVNVLQFDPLIRVSRFSGITRVSGEALHVLQDLCRK